MARIKEQTLLAFSMKSKVHEKTPVLFSGSRWMRIHEDPSKSGHQG